TCRRRCQMNPARACSRNRSLEAIFGKSKGGALRSEKLPELHLLRAVVGTQLPPSALQQSDSYLGGKRKCSLRPVSGVARRGCEDHCGTDNSSDERPAVHQKRLNADVGGPPTSAPATLRPARRWRGPVLAHLSSPCPITLLTGRGDKPHGPANWHSRSVP